jgi:malonyl CoA-acyl carrier protein transacylase
VSRAAVAFPGRGSYGPSSLGSLTATHPWVRHADAIRAESGLPALSELDAADRFTPALHLRPSNAWPLTFVASLLDAERIAADHEVVVVVASSTGWYTALAASGALGFDDAFRLVQGMAIAAEEPLPDGDQPAELVYALTSDSWDRDEARSSAVDRVLADTDDGAYRALELGSHAVIAGTAAAIDRVATALPPVTVGGRAFPLKLATGDAWHTPLRAAVARSAAEGLGDLQWDRPNVTIVDGRGVRWTPWAADPQELARETLTGLADAPYDFARAFRVALREYAPDAVLLPGPGTTLGAACAQLIVADGYRGIRTRAEFEATQAGPNPILLSVRR